MYKVIITNNNNATLFSWNFDDKDRAVAWGASWLTTWQEAPLDSPNPERYAAKKKLRNDLLEFEFAEQDNVIAQIIEFKSMNRCYNCGEPTRKIIALNDASDCYCSPVCQQAAALEYAAEDLVWEWFDWAETQGMNQQ